MSERERNLGPNDPTSELGGGDANVPAKGRPATGAGPLHTPGSINREWRGGAAATDFLGLDSEPQLDFVLTEGEPLAFAQNAGPVHPDAHAPNSNEYAQGQVAMPYAAPTQAANPYTPTPAPLQPTPVGEGGTSESWLLSIENGGGADADTAEPVDPEADPAPAKNKKHARAAGGAGKKRALVALSALVVIGALGAGGWYLKDHRPAFLSKYFGGEQVAQVPPSQPTTPTTPAGTKKPTKPNPAPTKPADPKVATTTPTPTSPVDETSPEDGHSPDEVVTLVDIPLEPRGGETTPVVPTIQFPPDNAPVNTTPSDTTGLGLRTTPSPTTSTTPNNDRPLPGGMRRATAEDLAGLWLEKTLPGPAQIEGDRVIRTAAVGRVRALIVGGEYFEGNLHAVGQKRIWLELELGRISFESGTVRELVQMPPVPVVASGPKKGQKDLSALPHVEVRLPGGAVTGRLVGRDGKFVTLVTDDGLRAVFESEDVRPLTPRNTRVVGRLSKLEAAKPGS